MKISKLVLSVAAVSAVSAAMAISASASTMTASYADGTVTLGGVPSTGASQTLLVLDTVDLTTVEAANIKQIDQKDDGSSFTSVPVGTLADGTYEVRIGGDGSVTTAEFTVGEGGGELQTIELVIGNVDDNTSVNMNDALKTARYVVKSKDDKGNVGVAYKLTDGDGTYLIGNVDDNTSINMNDALKIARYVVKSKDDTGLTGNKITVLAE